MGRIVKSLAIGVAVAMGAALTTGAQPAHAGTPAFSSCSALLKKYPSGVAASSKSAAEAMLLGYLQPTVQPKVYRQVRKKLDPGSLGYACPVRIGPSTTWDDPRNFSDDPDGDSSVCRLLDRSGDAETPVGFPRPTNRLKARGVNRIQVTYVTFPDYPAAKSGFDPVAHFASVKKLSNDYFANASYGLTTLEWDVSRRPLEAPFTIGDYGLKVHGNDVRAPGELYEKLLQDLMSAGDPHIDYSGYDAVLFMLDPAIPEGVADLGVAYTAPPEGYPSQDGPVMNVSIMGGSVYRDIAWVVVHEMGHLFGVTDLYDQFWTTERPYDELFRFSGHFDLMSRAPGLATELLAWNRWIIGWLRDNQVTCLDTPGSSQQVLTSTSVSGDLSRMLVVPTSDTTAVVVESRRRNPYCFICDAGVLVYEVNTAVTTGRGPIRIIRGPGSVDPLFADAFVTKGEAVSFSGVEISTLGSSLNSDWIEVKVSSQMTALPSSGSAGIR